MFGKNQIVGQKWFRTSAESTQGKLFVTSIFYTLQGEGPFAGHPAVFVRLAKCNLNCSFCDTFFDDGDWLTNQQIIDQCRQAVADFHNISSDQLSIVDQIMEKSVLVLTGGEPMLQSNITTLIDDNLSRFKHIQIETNGLLWQEVSSDVFIICSPKCSEKTAKYLKPHPNILFGAHGLKFVVSADPSSPYHTVPDWVKDFHGEIYISPMNVYNDIPRQSKQLRMETNQISLKQRSEIDEVVSFWTADLLNRQVNQQNHEYAARYALKNNFRLNLQMHLYASLA